MDRSKPESHSSFGMSELQIGIYGSYEIVFEQEQNRIFQ